MLRPASFPPHASRIAAHRIAQHRTALQRLRNTSKPPGPQQIAHRKQGLPVGPTSLTPPPRGSWSTHRRRSKSCPLAVQLALLPRPGQRRRGGCETTIAMTRCLSRSSLRRKMNPLDVKAPRSGFSPFPGTRAWGGFESPCLTAQP